MAIKNMEINITPEMIEAARQKKLNDERMVRNNDVQDPGAEGICIGCE